MNKFTALLVAALLSSFSFASFAATMVSEIPKNQQPIGIIGVTAQSDLGSLEDKLGEKEDRLGGASFRITPTAGNNFIHGATAVYQ